MKSWSSFLIFSSEMISLGENFLESKTISSIIQNTVFGDFE